MLKASLRKVDLHRAHMQQADLSMAEEMEDERLANPVVEEAEEVEVELTEDVAGQSLYEQKLQDPEVLSRRAKALQRTSETDWRNAALTKGVQRITSGMEAGASKQAANYEPYAQALEAVTLPPKSADRLWLILIVELSQLFKQW